MILIQQKQGIVCFYWSYFMFKKNTHYHVSLEFASYVPIRFKTKKQTHDLKKNTHKHKKYTHTEFNKF